MTSDLTKARFRDDREDDQRILDALYLRDEGWLNRQIAKRLGWKSIAGMRGRLSRVRAELEASER